MPNRFATISDDDMEDFHYVVTHARRSRDNFEVYERPMARLPEGQISAVIDIVEVKHKLTGVRQSYQIGHETGDDQSWLVLFAKDLASGLFDGEQTTALGATVYSPVPQMGG